MISQQYPRKEFVMFVEQTKPSSVEKEVQATSGWPMLFFNLALLLSGPTTIVMTIIGAAEGRVVDESIFGRILTGILLAITGGIMLGGHFALQPNEARVLILFGAYKGTVRRSGFYWANPFYSRTRAKIPLKSSAPDAHGPTKGTAIGSPTGGIVYQSLSTKISLRAHNFNSDKIKVNDKRGNPIEIAAVVVWRVEDTAQAAFDVEDYESYVQVQSESAIRSIASLYAYDHGEEHETTLRGGGEEVSVALKKELQARLVKTGVVVEEARLTHLAYAPEIAQAMLRRQQAEAVIAARQKIVHGAVSMVDMALRELAEKDVVKLDDERKAAMVSNLLVVLCGESEASPVINAGTLYN
jgi:regulator of protease activity HflC (stomatin/prohibitin superfamily)